MSPKVALSNWMMAKYAKLETNSETYTQTGEAVASPSPNFKAAHRAVVCTNPITASGAKLPSATFHAGMPDIRPAIFSGATNNNATSAPTHSASGTKYGAKPSPNFGTSFRTFRSTLMGEDSTVVKSLRLASTIPGVLSSAFFVVSASCSVPGAISVTNAVESSDAPEASFSLPLASSVILLSASFTAVSTSLTPWVITDCPDANESARVAMASSGS